MFESWSDEKKDKYEIDEDKYDHTDVIGRPTILFNQYCNYRTPFLMVIHLWDKGRYYILSSLRDPLKIGTIYG